MMCCCIVRTIWGVFLFWLLWRDLHLFLLRLFPPFLFLLSLYITTCLYTCFSTKRWWLNLLAGVLIYFGPLFMINLYINQLIKQKRRTHWYPWNGSFVKWVVVDLFFLGGLHNDGCFSSFRLLLLFLRCHVSRGQISISLTAMADIKRRTYISIIFFRKVFHLYLLGESNSFFFLVYLKGWLWIRKWRRWRSCNCKFIKWSW